MFFVPSIDDLSGIQSLNVPVFVVPGGPVQPGVPAVLRRVPERSQLELRRPQQALQLLRRPILSTKN